MYSLLIADDEQIIREGIKRIIDWESEGFFLQGEALNGDQVMQRLIEDKPDLAVLDIRMPGPSSLEAIKKARANGYTGHVIIISGYSDFKYAQEAIHQGVECYLTKPVDETELSESVRRIKNALDDEKKKKDSNAHYLKKIKGNIVRDLMLGECDASDYLLTSLHLDKGPFKVVIYEKYLRDDTAQAYDFADLIRVTNQDNNSFDTVTIDHTEVLLLKGELAIGKFKDFLERYEREKPPQEGSPLDSVFISYGETVNTIDGIQDSYQEALVLLGRRFFCDQAQHTIGYEALPAFAGNTPIITEDYLTEYAKTLCGYLQSFNRSLLAETLSRLNRELYNSNDSIDDCKLFLADLFLQIKERMTHLYSGTEIPFPSNTEIISFIKSKYYLYEILLYFTNRFETIMGAIGNSNRDSVLEDITNYIDHNFAANITLENIAPLFGYNSSYLGKIFTKKTGTTFNTYLDKVRIEHSKELLMQDDIKVYTVAERVGYKTVDYFHIKFKKYVGMSPAEYRKKQKEN